MEYTVTQLSDRVLISFSDGSLTIDDLISCKPNFSLTPTSYMFSVTGLKGKDYEFYCDNLVELYSTEFSPDCSFVLKTDTGFVITLVRKYPLFPKELKNKTIEICFSKPDTPLPKDGFEHPMEKKSSEATRCSSPEPDIGFPVRQIAGMR